MKLLIIEDEPKAAAYLRQGLTEAGYVVDVAADGETGLSGALAGNYDLIICDVMLPRRDGFSFVSTFRSNGQKIPVLMVTALHDVDSRVRALDLGADDYIVKPYAFAELIARVRALLRRGANLQSEVYRIADLVCDVRLRRVARAGRRIDLTPKEFSLLLFLLERQGEVVPRTVLADRVWGMNFDSDTNVIDVHVRRLRSKLDAQGEPSLLHTVRGVGYCIEDRGELD